MKLVDTVEKKSVYGKDCPLGNAGRTVPTGAAADRLEGASRGSIPKEVKEKAPVSEPP